MGIAIQIRTLSPAGGCVVIATTRQIAGFVASTIADSMVVLGSVTVARLSHDRTGLALATSGLGGVRISAGGPWARPCAANSATIDAETKNTHFDRFSIARRWWAGTGLESSCAVLILKASAAVARVDIETAARDTAGSALTGRHPPAAREHSHLFD